MHRKSQKVNSSEYLVQFAQRTIQQLDTLKFPGSAEVQSLRSHYVELSVSDSEGKIRPVSSLLGQGARLILVGDPGSGKTTALRFFTIRKSELFIDGASDVLPIYLPLRHIPFRDAKTIFESINLEPKLIGGSQILFLLDGLDEVPADFRAAAWSMVDDLLERYPPAQVVIASRPAGLSPSPPDEFRYFHLESLNSVQAHEFVSRLSDDRSQGWAFETTLNSTPFLQGLSHNPLLIHLLWEVFRHQARLPAVRADIYQTACDFLLSRWDAAKGILSRQNILDVRSVHEILERVAFDAFMSSQYRIPSAKVRRSVSEFFNSSGLDQSGVDSVIAQLLSSGILVQSEPDAISFVHLTFMEFYAAKRLVETPRKLASLLVDVGPIAKETILFAAGMILDVAPLVESAVDRRELILAANCLREGRTENRTLEAYVLDHLQRELGSDLIRKLAGGVIEEKYPQPESIHSVLRKEFAEVRDSGLPSHEKGKRFEKFAERFFRQVFNIVGLNRNTENGEIDLILENTGTDPFWTEWGGDIFVECKNWDTSRPLKETAAFSNKVRMSRGKLGFFVSVAGFTEDALRTLKNQVADRDAPLIVPISGEDMDTMLEHREKFDLFFREAIRKIKHLHKW